MLGWTLSLSLFDIVITKQIIMFMVYLNPTTVGQGFSLTGFT